MAVFSKPLSSHRLTSASAKAIVNDLTRLYLQHRTRISRAVYLTLFVALINRIRNAIAEGVVLLPGLYSYSFIHENVVQVSANSRRGRSNRQEEGRAEQGVLQEPAQTTEDMHTWLEEQGV